MMLCKNGTDVDVVTHDGVWVGSRKLDGVRCLAYCNGETIKLLGRSGSDYTAKFSDIAEALKGFVGTLDGEIVVGDNFQLTQSRTLTQDKLRTKVLTAKYPATYYVFDILSHEHQNLKDLSLSERLIKLKEVVPNNSFIEVVEHNSNLPYMFSQAKEKKWEGIVIKNPLSKYRENYRSPDWLKIKLKKSKDIKFIKFVENPAGIRVENEKGLAIQVSGDLNSGKVKQDFEKKGYAIIEVEFLEEFESGNLRQPVFKDVKDEIILFSSTEKY